MNNSPFSVSVPLRVGLVGTGYAAARRAEALIADSRTGLIAIAGQTPDRTQAFSHEFGAIAHATWAELVERSDLDLIVISTVNCDHSAIAQAALRAGKHVIVEYPLALDVAEADALLALAQSQNQLLHVEHIELLGGIHQSLKSTLPEIGRIFYARYATVKPEHPAPRRWTYHPEAFGFPLMGALSRLHRLTDLFGAVGTVSCQARFWDESGEEVVNDYYKTCLCSAQLRFKNGVVADVTYAKGETFWQAERRLEVHGDRGALIFDGNQGTLIQDDNHQSLEVGGRRGLFAKDTAMVLEHLLSGTPLYVTPEASLETLKVADAARRSALNEETIQLA